MNNVSAPAMSGPELREAREALGLTLVEMGELLGFGGKNLRQTMHHYETGKKPIRPVQALLVEAYLSGFRPKDPELRSMFTRGRGRLSKKATEAPGSASADSTPDDTAQPAESR